MNPTILIVDDNTDAADAMGKLLTLVGFNVAIAYSGQEALDTAYVLKPRVILLDIRMPELDGYAVAKKLRTTQGLSDVVLVALTGFGQQEDRERAEEAGFNHHLTKPVSLSELKNVLDQYSLH